jgi:hypothetical protein
MGAARARRVSRRKKRDKTEGLGVRVRSILTIYPNYYEQVKKISRRNAPEPGFIDFWTWIDDGFTQPCSVNGWAKPLARISKSTNLRRSPSTAIGRNFGGNKSQYVCSTSETDPAAKRTGIKAFVFPLWFVAQESQPSKFAGRDYQTRAILPYNRLVNGCYLNDLNKKVSVVPIRFIQACPNGHISDIDWYKFVNKDCRSNCPAQLYLDEGGTGNNFADIFVRCDKCKKRRPLGDAIYSPDNILGFCQGYRPCLGNNAREDCIVNGTGTDNIPPKRERNRLLVRSASNAYFAQTLSVISIPDRDRALKAAVDLVYEDFLQYAEEEDDIRKERKKARVAEAIASFTDE